MTVGPRAGDGPLKLLISRGRERTRRGIVGRGRTTVAPAPDLDGLLERLNPATLARATGQKVILHRHLTALGLPVPRLHGAVGRAGGWDASRDRPVTGAPATGRFLAGLAGEVVVRPSPSSGGAGVRALRRDGPDLVDLDGRRHTPAALAAELHVDPRAELFVVQARVAAHSSLARLLPGGALPTARITTFVAADGAAQVAHACLVLPVLHAADGGRRPTVEIEATTGIPGSRGANTVIAVWADGERLPHWEAACALACRGAALLTPQRSIAWDIAITPSGAVILGADSRYAPVESGGFDRAVRAMERAAAGGGRLVMEGAP